jgi:hypothetical protein
MNIYIQGIPRFSLQVMSLYYKMQKLVQCQMRSEDACSMHACMVKWNTMGSSSHSPFEDTTKAFKTQYKTQVL